MRKKRSSPSPECRVFIPARPSEGPTPQLQPTLNESAICYPSQPRGEVSVWSRLQSLSFKSLNTRSHRLPCDSPPGIGLGRGQGQLYSDLPLRPCSLCVSLSCCISVSPCACLFVPVSLAFSLMKCARAHTHIHRHTHKHGGGFLHNQCQNVT